MLLVVASWATCHFGVEHEIAGIPAETRDQMADFDWVGVEWIGRGHGDFLRGRNFGVSRACYLVEPPAQGAPGFVACSTGFGV